MKGGEIIKRLKADGWQTGWIARQITLAQPLTRETNPMLYPVYVHLGDAKHAHGVTFPDFPGCFSAADDWNDLPAAIQDGCRGAFSRGAGCRASPDGAGEIVC